jgi:hypothetical protein
MVEIKNWNGIREIYLLLSAVEEVSNWIDAYADEKIEIAECYARQMSRMRYTSH